jgi:DnaJ family protein A protein 2
LNDLEHSRARFHVILAIFNSFKILIKFSKMFFGGGGFPFGGGFEEMRGGPRGPKKEIDNKKFYDLLGVPQTATFDEIKKAFRKLALKHHPDRGGDKEKFQELNMAYETLTDPKKRDLYDQYGEDGIKDGAGGGPDISDLLGGMFGGGMGGRGGAR